MAYPIFRDFLTTRIAYSDIFKQLDRVPFYQTPKNVTVMAPTKPFRVISLMKGGRPGVRMRMPTGGCSNESLSSNTWPTEPNSLVQGSCLQAVGPLLAFVEDKHDLSKYYSVWANKWARTRHKAGRPGGDF